MCIPLIERCVIASKCKNWSRVPMVVPVCTTRAAARWTVVVISLLARKQLGLRLHGVNTGVLKGSSYSDLLIYNLVIKILE